MFDHVSITVRDLDASVRFYTQALAALGHVCCTRDAQSASFGPEEAAALYLSARSAAGDASAPIHLALRAATRATVDGFHRCGLAAGGRDHGGPGLRADYGPSYYAAFLLDPDGHNVEAVCLGER